MSEYTIIENYVVDQDGEVLGNVVESGAIANLTALEAVLQKIQQVQLDLNGQEAILNKMIEQQQKITARKRSYLDYLQNTYMTPIEAFAQGYVANEKSKTINTMYGSVSVRTVKGGLKVADANLALSVAQKRGWVEAIKVSESFLISKLTDNQRQELIENLPEGFEVTADKEVVTVKVLG